MVPGACAETQRAAACIDFRDPMHVKIAQLPLIQHIKIAGIYAAVSFHNILNATTSPLLTGFRHSAQEYADVILKQIGRASCRERVCLLV